MKGQEVSEGLRFSREAKIVTLLAGAAFSLWLVSRVQRVLGPFLWAAITAYVFSPLVDWLEARTRLRRTPILILLYLIGLAAAVWASTALVPLVIHQLGELVAELPRILTALLDNLASLEQYLSAEQIGIRGLALDPQVLVNEAVRNVQNLVTYVTRQAIPAVFNALEAMAQIILFLIVTFYLLRASGNARERLGHLVPRPYRQEVLGLIGEIDRVLGAYIRGQFLLIGIMAGATFVALSLLHVRYALTVSLVSGVLEVIPLFGPIAATSIAASIALFQPNVPFGWSNLTLALVVVLAYTVLRQIEDHLVVPNLFGPMVNLHPLLVLFALFAGGNLAGFTGLVIAVPTAAALKIVLVYLHGKIWDERPAADPAPATSHALLADPSPASGETQ